MNIVLTMLQDVATNIYFGLLQHLFYTGRLCTCEINAARKQQLFYFSLLVWMA